MKHYRVFARKGLVGIAALAAMAGFGAERASAQAARYQLAQAGDDLLAGDDDVLDTGSDLLAGDDDVLDTGSDLLAGEEEVLAPPTAESQAEVAATVDIAAAAAAAHNISDRFPSAHECKVCHPKQYREWSTSPHAYAQVSPIFNSMQAMVSRQTNGTNGDFCIRCHTQVGMNLGEREFMTNVDRSPTSFEGITCIVCHRLGQEMGKVSGRYNLIEGHLVAPLFGPEGNAEMERVLANTDQYRVVTNPDEPGRKIHAKIEKFDYLRTNAFCGSCHDVNLLNGFRLEEAFSDFKASPAAKRGVTCHDCHMGNEQGKFNGDKVTNYGHGPAAIVGGVPTKDRRLTAHFFAGPDYSVVHPGIYPHNSDATEMATIREWLQYDYKAGWGTDEFENNLPDDYVFPSRWTSVDDRYDARAILNDQFELTEVYNEKRLETLRNGFQAGEIRMASGLLGGAKLKVEVKNATDGHSISTGFDAERLFFLQITVMDESGNVIKRSGDYDPNGDVRDQHSLYVHNMELPLDNELFSMQSKFIVRMARGGDREQVLAVNYSPDPLPYVRPGTNSTIVTGRPAGARIHRNNIGPLRSRWGTYAVPGGKSGRLLANVKMIAGMVPVNLVNEIKGVGFDYDMTARDIADALTDGHRVLFEHDLVIENGKIVSNTDVTRPDGRPYRPYTRSDTTVFDLADVNPHEGPVKKVAARN